MRQAVHLDARAKDPTPDKCAAEFLPFAAVGACISALLYPHAEVVIHDLRTDRVAAIWNSFSRRAVGDPSLLGNIADDLEVGQVFGPYDSSSKTLSPADSGDTLDPEAQDGKTDFFKRSNEEYYTAA